jgi:mRNA-degrading endonuclease RelE of RelBE toxin-antitoxin system
MKQIEWKNKALRELRKIKSTQDRDDIYEAVGKLVLFPDCDNIKYILNSDSLYRLRVKNWRVIFSSRLEIITIEEVKRRNERTYR